MCDDQGATGSAAAQTPDLTRRRFLHATGAMAAAAAALNKVPHLPTPSAAGDVTATGMSAISMAMHVHSSFSEQDGSMQAQLFQATTNAVDVLWWTDHDARMDGINYRKTVHFTSLTAERGGPGESGPWLWTKRQSGPLAAGSTGGIVASPSSPLDPVAGGAMHLSAKSKTTALAKFGFYANSHPAGDNYRDNLTGQTLAIEVMPTTGWTHGYLELLVTTSYHEATGGRPAGDYSLSYRFAPPSTPAGRTAAGIQGVITIPVTPGTWSSVTINPSNDIAALWPDLDYRDFTLFMLTLSAASTGDAVGGYVDYLRFTRAMTGEVQLQMQRDMESRLAPQYPAVVQRQGLEVSWLLPHINWFGGTVTVPDYGTTRPGAYTTFLRNTAIPQIHAAGGLVSYNHPYGYGGGAEIPVAQQDALLPQVAGKLLSTRALGVDLLEVGYPVRQGVNLAHHVALWDVMSRNAIFLTGNGTNDDHYGQDWLGIVNNWFTSTWAVSTAESDLLASLAAGRAWCAALSEYRGSLDLLVDGTAPMGSVSVSTVNSRRLVASATGIPAGGSLQVVRGVVDYAGTAALTANSLVVASYPAAALAGGSVSLAVDTSKACFVRTQVLNAAGTVVGLSNPVWLLRAAPPGGIPAPRAA
jgi:hypothetical protein